MNYILFSFSFLLAAQLNNAEWLKYVLWWSLPLLFFGLGALGYTIYRLVKMFGKARVARLPLTESGEVEITKTGKLNLSLEAPRFTFTAGSGLNYELLDVRGGRAIELQSTIASLMGRKGGSTMTYPMRSFEIAETGKYLLKVSGFKPGTDYSSHFLIIESPTALKSVFYILAIIFAGWMFVGGLIFTFIAAAANK